jgi:glycosyltransferase involved in cell wall biosynthesis
VTRFDRLAIIGNALPRRCGIATFTTDLHAALCKVEPGLNVSVAAMTDHRQVYDYPDHVRIQIRDDVPEDYVRAAEALNRSGVEVVSLQHEFGIFGGPAGERIVTLLERLAMPVVTTFHTVLREPTVDQRHVVTRIAALSSKVVVMARRGRDMLMSVYGVPAGKIAVIAHGIPDVPFEDTRRAKQKHGFTDRTVILTFGLLSPSKGVEVMIDGLPEVIRRCPDVLYIVLGATHPNLVRDHGEAYRDSLAARAERLGVQDHVLFLDRFVDRATLLDFIAMCDVYVTPYLNASQLTSGTLAYSFGLGKAVVSTPYWHAEELLADGRGVLVPFGDSAAMSLAVADLLTDEDRLDAMRRRAYALGRTMVWEMTAGRYLKLFEQAIDHAQERRPTPRPAEPRPVRIVAPSPSPPRTPPSPAVPGAPARGEAFYGASVRPPALATSHLLAMCDDTGLAQHAVYTVPDRAHGYCVDDNARALMLCVLQPGAVTPALGDALTFRFAAFVQHAWNPDTGRFRNFMGFDRQWREETGSEDSHGRTLWALGECSARDVNRERRCWAAGLFVEAADTVRTFTAPRAWAFTLLGLAAFAQGQPAGDKLTALGETLANRLLTLLHATAEPAWTWFETSLAYDNARLCQGLIAAGQWLNNPAYTQAGLTTLHWLMVQETNEHGHFRPVGNRGFGAGERAPPERFDQQPLEAAAAISACLAAARLTGGGHWRRHADRAFGWFMGENDLSIPLVDLNSGACCDGLHPDRANENRGAESVLAYLVGFTEMRAFYAQSAVAQRASPGQRALSA